MKIVQLIYLVRSATIAALMFSPFTQHHAMNKVLNLLLAGLTLGGTTLALAKNNEKLADATVKAFNVLNNAKNTRKLIEDAKKDKNFS